MKQIPIERKNFGCEIKFRPKLTKFHVHEIKFPPKLIKFADCEVKFREKNCFSHP